MMLGRDGTFAQAATAAPPLMEACDLWLQLGGRAVVDRVSLTLHAGEWVAVVGPNGAGKSSLLTLLAGLRTPDAGEVRLRGRALGQWSARERARHLAWLSQRGEAEGELSVLDVVRLGRLPHHGLFGAPGPDDEAAVQAAMRETECEALSTRRLGELSGGERQRVLLARALAVQAPVMLLDEPTTHLDAPHQRALVARLARHAREGGAAMAVLHDPTLALTASRVLVMAAGRLLAQGAPGDPALQHALVQAFGGAFSIEALHKDGVTRWVALPEVS